MSNLNLVQSAFDLVVVQPIVGKPGRRVADMTIFGKNVTDAVAKVRADCGPSVIILQKSSYEQSVSDYLKRLDAEEQQANGSEEGITGAGQEAA